MTVGNFDALPPDLRFYAGGDRSLRGFDYHEIGEVSANGNIIGGEYLAVASAEYEHYFNESWGAAVFVDAGRDVDPALQGSCDRIHPGGLSVEHTCEIQTHGLCESEYAEEIKADLEPTLCSHSETLRARQCIRQIDQK